MKKLGLILLAAGGSTRLGSPKQLLSYGGQSLLQRAAVIALETACRPVVAVLGAGAEKLRAELAGLAVHPVENLQWERGMGSSLHMGLTALLAMDQAQRLDGALFILCDQPLVTSAALNNLIDRFCPEKGHSIIAASYDGSVGVPAVIGNEHFRELLDLPDEAGAKKLLLAHPSRLMAIPLPEAAIDIDTREQYERLMRINPTNG